MSSQIIPLKAGEDSRVRAEFRPWRPLAFELQRRGYAARDWVLPGSSASVLHGRWPSCGVAEKARIGRDLFRSEDDPPDGHMRFGGEPSWFKFVSVRRKGP